MRTYRTARQNGWNIKASRSTTTRSEIEFIYSWYELGAQTAVWFIILNKHARVPFRRETEIDRDGIDSEE